MQTRATEGLGQCKPGRKVTGGGNGLISPFLCLPAQQELPTGYPFPPTPRKPEGHKPFGGICDQPAGGRQQGVVREGEHVCRANTGHFLPTHATRRSQSLSYFRFPELAIAHHALGFLRLIPRLLKKPIPGPFLTPPALQGSF